MNLHIVKRPGDTKGDTKISHHHSRKITVTPNECCRELRHGTAAILSTSIPFRPELPQPSQLRTRHVSDPRPRIFTMRLISPSEKRSDCALRMKRTRSTAA